MKKLIIPVVLVTLGTGAAFAMNANFDGSKAPVNGYRIVDLGGGNTLCVDAQKTCSDIEGPICKWSDGVTNLHRFDSPTMCGQEAYEPQN